MKTNNNESRARQSRFTCSILLIALACATVGVANGQTLIGSPVIQREFLTKDQIVTVHPIIVYFRPPSGQQLYCDCKSIGAQKKAAAKNSGRVRTFALYP